MNFEKILQYFLLDVTKKESLGPADEDEVRYLYSLYQTIITPVTCSPAWYPLQVHNSVSSCLRVATSLCHCNVYRTEARLNKLHVTYIGQEFVCMFLLLSILTNRQGTCQLGFRLVTMLLQTCLLGSTYVSMLASALCSCHGHSM